MNDIWIEKYRPRTLDEVIGQQHVVERLKAYVKSGNLPHLLFSGPAGTGKTSCAIALARDLFGEDWRASFLELNASDERGIKTVRVAIKDYARTASISDVPFKIIFLDEADSLTPEAQAALRRTMERYTSSTRFILSCNYSSKIIEPIQSRCAVFRFRRFKDEDVEEYIRRIAEGEGLEITEDGMKALIYLAEGDLRKVTNALQVAASLSSRIDMDAVHQGIGTVRPQKIRDMIEMAMRGEFVKAREILDELLVDVGLSGEDIVRQIHRELLNIRIRDDSLLARLMEKVGETEFRLVEGGSPRIQLEALLAAFGVVNQER